MALEETSNQWAIIEGPEKDPQIWTMLVYYETSISKQWETDGVFSQ